MYIDAHKHIDWKIDGGFDASQMAEKLARRFHDDSSKFEIYSLLLSDLETFRQGGVGPDDIEFPFTCGIHPWELNIEALQSKFAYVEEYSLSKYCVGVGETGFDRVYGMEKGSFEDKKTVLDLQFESVLQHFKLAADIDRQTSFSQRGIKFEKTIMVFHLVKSSDLFQKFLKDCRPSMPCLLHDFRGAPVFFETLAKRPNIFFGVGSLLERSDQKSKVLLKALMNSRSLLETDASLAKIDEIYRRFAEHSQYSSEYSVVQRVQKVFTILLQG